MQITSATTDTAKKSRAKKDAIVAAAPAAKKPRARKKVSSEPTVQVEKSSALETAVATRPENLAENIAVAAYFLAAQRNFAPGRELDDWLAAEQMVLNRHAA
jgi:Protein of unknown function (DUF2934)